MNKEEKTNQLSKSQTTAKEDELTDEEEYIVLTGKKIKYVTQGGVELQIPQLTIYDSDLLASINKRITEKITLKQLDDIKIEVFAEITKTDVKDWHKKDMISFEDFENIEGILNYVFIRRKKAFEKKTIKKEEIQKISDILRSTLD